MAITSEINTMLKPLADILFLYFPDYELLLSLSRISQKMCHKNLLGEVVVGR